MNVNFCSNLTYYKYNILYIPFLLVSACVFVTFFKIFTIKIKNTFKSKKKKKPI